jgi:Flp pilus assembly protein TadG
VQLWLPASGGATQGNRESQERPKHTVKRLQSLTRKIFTFARCDRGVAVVEFAVLVPVLLLIVFGTADFGLAMNTYNNETQLANEGARLAVVNKNPGPGSLQAYIKSQGDTADIQNNATVGICFPDGVATVGHPVMVTVTIAHSWLPYLKNVVGLNATTTITGKAVMRLEQNPTAYSANGCAS